MKAIYKRLQRLESTIIREPTLVYLPDGKVYQLFGPRGFLVDLFCNAMEPEKLTPGQSAQLELIRQSVSSWEPGGARIIEVIQAKLHGPLETDNRRIPDPIDRD